MPFVPVEPGVELFVQDVGSGDPVVLVAGFGLTHELWDREVCELASTHRVICIDQRGHGKSSKPIDGYDVPRLSADLIAVLDALEVARCTLVGWSFGGQVAFKTAADLGPDRIAQLVLVGSNGVRATRSEEFPFGRPVEEVVDRVTAAEREDRIASRRTALLSAVHKPLSDDTVDWMLGISLQMPSWAGIACYESMLTADLVDHIDRVSMPVLQVIGAADPVHSARGAGWLQERLARSELEVIDECGHYPMLEAPDHFDRVLTEFIRRT